MPGAEISGGAYETHRRVIPDFGFSGGREDFYGQAVLRLRHDDVSDPEGEFIFRILIIYGVYDYDG